jgi:hypothetical protein
MADPSSCRGLYLLNYGADPRVEREWQIARISELRDLVSTGCSSKLRKLYQKWSRTGEFGMIGQCSLVGHWL